MELYNVCQKFTMFVINSICESERALSVKDLGFNKACSGMFKQTPLVAKSLAKKEPATRREILSIVSSINVPLGLVSPCILPARAILQDLCFKGLGWDDQIPKLSKQKWKALLRELPELEQFKIPQCFKPPYRSAQREKF